MHTEANFMKVISIERYVVRSLIYYTFQYSTRRVKLDLAFVEE